MSLTSIDQWPISVCPVRPRIDVAWRAVEPKLSADRTRGELASSRVVPRPAVRLNYDSPVALDRSSLSFTVDLRGPR